MFITIVEFFILVAFYLNTNCVNLDRIFKGLRAHGFNSNSFSGVNSILPDFIWTAVFYKENNSLGF
jgi:hypothetical protein